MHVILVREVSASRESIGGLFPLSRSVRSHQQRPTRIIFFLTRERMNRILLQLFILIDSCPDASPHLTPYPVLKKPVYLSILNLIPFSPVVVIQCRCE